MSTQSPYHQSASNVHLRSTRMLDFDDGSLVDLVAGRAWAQLEPHDRIGAVYSFVRDGIAFGFNESDAIPASRVLADGLGQCNTKTTLLMALLRGAGIPCRLRGSRIHKRVQRGILGRLVYRLAPVELLHTWTEVLHDGRWVGLEGVILDSAYLDGLRCSLGNPCGRYVGFAVATSRLEDPPVDWTGGRTAIQSEAVTTDLGVFPDPDSFYREYGANLSGPKAAAFRSWVRPHMNRVVAGVRNASR